MRCRARGVSPSFAKLEPKRTPQFNPKQTLNLNSKGGAARVAASSQPFNVVKLSATDVLAPTTMKNAAKCDTSCDLQNPVNHQNFERILRFREFPGSMLVGVSVDTTRPTLLLLQLCCCCCWLAADSACSGARAPSAPNLVNERSIVPS